MTDLDVDVEIEEESQGILRHFRTGGLGSDAVWGAIHDVSQLGLTFVTFTLLGRQLGAADYGRYAGIYGLVGPVGGMTWTGITLAVLKRRLNERRSAADTSREFFALTVGLGVAAAVLGTFIGSRVIHGLSVRAILAVMGAEVMVNAVSSVAISMVQAENGFAPATRLRMGILALRGVAVVGLAAAGALSIANLALCYSISFTAYAIVLLRRILPGHGIPVLWGRPTRDTIATAAKFSLPIGATTMQQDGDKSVLNAYHYASFAGEYAAAFRVVSIGLTPLKALDGAAFQRFFKSDDDARNQHVKRAAKYSVLAFGISIVLAAGLLLLRPLVTFLLGDEFAAAERMIPWLLPFLPLTALSDVPANALLGLGRPGARAWVYTASAVVTVALYIVLIPLAGDSGEPWKGAVAGTLVGESFLGLVGWVVLLHYQRKHNRSLDERAGAASE